MLNRVIVINDPVNIVDPDGLQASQWNVGNSFPALHGSKPERVKPMTPEQKQKFSEALQNLMDNISNFFPGLKIITVPEEILKEIMEELDPLKPEEAKACRVK